MIYPLVARRFPGPKRQPVRRKTPKTPCAGAITASARDADRSARRMHRPARREKLCRRILVAREPAAGTMRQEMTSSASPYSTGWPSSTKIAVTVPARGATISLKVFIASMSSSLSPTSTFEPTSMNALASGEGRR
ncbi:hypothetical protein WYO_1015 [Methylobacterium sp. GXF4]|nr:hypothetical protein WYO_1015 [Methylobacterium sp. GXF4]